MGFIAQQVNEHLPEAVSIQTGYIPNEMRNLDVSWNGLDMSSDLQNVSGIKYRFYVSNDISDNEKMVELVGDENNCFTFEEKWENVFCYGKEVDDFHILDKQKLFAINFSATQELDRKVIALEEENKTLKERLEVNDISCAALTINASVKLPVKEDAGAPSTTPAVGTMTYNSSDGKLYIYNGSAWKSFSPDA